MEAPERVWMDEQAFDGYARHVAGDTKYIRADLAEDDKAALRAELEHVKVCLTVMSTPRDDTSGLPAMAKNLKAYIAAALNPVHKDRLTTE